MARKNSLREQVTIFPYAINIIEAESNLHRKLETGGLLLGKIYPSGQIIVKEATNGGPNSSRTHASFTPDIDYLNEKIEEAERRGLIFLGEWHLHPSSLGRPSSQDCVAIKYILDDNDLKSYVALIVRRRFLRSSFSLNVFMFTQMNNRNYDEISLKIIRESEVKEMVPWYMSDSGKMRLKFDFEEMSKRFPQYMLLMHEDSIFWKRDSDDYIIKLIYSDEFPTYPIEIMIDPVINFLENEPSCYYAVIAAQVAELRKNNVSSYRLNDGASPLISTRNSSTQRDTVKWYESDDGIKIFNDTLNVLEHYFNDIKVFKLNNGYLSLNCSYVHNDRINVLFVFPDDYPVIQPNISVSYNDEAIDIDTPIESDWAIDPSIERYVSEVLEQIKMRV